MDAFPKFLEAYEKRELIFYMDVSVFSANQVNPKIWFTPQTEPVMIEKKKLGFKAIAVAAAINLQGEVIAWHVQDGAIDSDSYILFLRQVIKYTRRRKCKMMVDNLGVHRTKDVTEFCAKHRIQLIFNGTYSSWANPIERLWAWTKQRF